MSKPGLRRKKSSGFRIRYNSYIRNSVMDNTDNNGRKAKEKDEKYSTLLKRHITTFHNSNQTIIGSMFFSLLMDAKHNSSRYVRDRTNTLNSLYSFVYKNKAWKDLWVVMTSIEQKVYKSKAIVSEQLVTESMDMFRLNLPYSKMVFGINKKTMEPIIKQLPFYITNDLLNMFENPRSVGRKKSRELKTIQFQVVEWMHYLSFAYGLYDEENSDIIAGNGLNYADIPNIKLPRILDSDKLVTFINEQRKFTMNPNGVVIECYNCGDIDQIVMAESNGFLIWKIHFKKTGIILDHKGNLTQDYSGAEYCGYFDEDFFPRSLFTIHSDFIDFEMDLYTFILECFADIVCGTSALNKHFNRNAVNIGAMQIQDDINDKKLEKGTVGFRYTPRKVFNHAKSKSSSKSELNKELDKYFVSGHLRKLPEDHSASDEAVRHAAEYGIEIPTGYTFVRPYTSGEEKVRTHYIKRI